jgi:hypothetical protein
MFPNDISEGLRKPICVTNELLQERITWKSILVKCHHLSTIQGYTSTYRVPVTETPHHLLCVFRPLQNAHCFKPVQQMLEQKC